MLKNVKPCRIASGIHSSGVGRVQGAEPVPSPRARRDDPRTGARRRAGAPPAGAVQLAQLVVQACASSSANSARLFQ